MATVKSLYSSSSIAELSKNVDLAMKEIKEKEGRSKEMFHSHFCHAICELSANNWQWFQLNDGPQSKLLYVLGSKTAFEVIGANLSTSSSLGAEWLEKEVVGMVTRGDVETILWEECVPPVSFTDTSLSPRQNLLLKTLTRLPDLLSSKRGRQLHPSLYPNVYFKNLANMVHCCLKRAVDSIRGSNDVSVIFLAAMVAKASFIGHKDIFWSTLCPVLEVETKSDVLWQRLCQQLIKRIPEQCLESVLDGIIKFTTPSLIAPTPLYRLLGNIPHESSHAKFLLTHKYILGNPLTEPRTLFGYFNSNDKLKPLICEVLQTALPLWCDTSVQRHMSLEHHYRFTGIITLATTCYDHTMANKKVNTEFERLAMRGVQVHLESSIEIIRTRGMMVGEHLMRKFHPLSDDKLEFTYDDKSEEVKWFQSLMKAIAEQEKDLKLLHSKKQQISQVHEAEPKSKSTEPSSQYGTGLAQVNTCSDDDSDDDLNPYDMSNDPDIKQTKVPRYIRTCIQDLISKDGEKKDVAIRTIKPLLLKSSLKDLSEICLDVVKMLLHCDILDDVEHLRMDSLIVITTKCPYKVAPYLCEEFYSPHYNLRQRMEILEILSQSAVNLSSSTKTETKIEELTPRQLKPWQQIVEERIKAKTRVISKGSSKLPLSIENKFIEVSGQFFFPLMINFDKKLSTLDLQGRDSFVLGQVLRTLGTVIQCATHSPILLSMSITLLDFCWTLKHHTDVCVRVGVLYCLCCILSSSSVFLPDLIEKGINEMLLWAKDVFSNDASNECRKLAGLALTLF